MYITIRENNKAQTLKPVSTGASEDKVKKTTNLTSDGRSFPLHDPQLATKGAELVKRVLR